ncbi:TPA: hypothetical protein DCL30_05845 [Candidatus Peribacteria bacterium]|nr:hypothetical protein [Candidatus Peribacteria bacterium]HAS34822.1 hypothetical protein [Candidatus Peribacteria bacterium]
MEVLLATCLAANNPTSQHPNKPNSKLVDTPYPQFTVLMMSSSPVVSVVIPCWDGAGKYVEEAVGSVERSTGVLYEIILVDDGSFDPVLRAALERIGLRGHRVIRQAHAGPSAARNRGFAQARGKYVLPLDADNRIEPRYLLKAVAAMDACEKVGVVYADFQMFGEEERVLHLPDFDPVSLLMDNYIDMCSLIRRETWEDCGGFDEVIPVMEDLEFWLNAFTRGWQVHHLSEVLFSYRMHADSFYHSVREDEKKQSLLTLWERYYHFMRPATIAARAALETQKAGAPPAPPPRARRWWEKIRPLRP